MNQDPLTVTQPWFHSRLTLLAAVGALYLIPIGGLLWWAASDLSSGAFWSLTSSGAVALLFGMCALFLLVTYWETSLPQKISLPNSEKATATEVDEVLQQKNQALDELQRKIALLHHDMFLKEEQIRHLESEKELWKKKGEELLHDYSQQNRGFQEELDKLNRLLQESKLTISEQRAAMELNLERMHQLEQKNDDLRYEIKTLIQVSQDERVEQELPLNIDLEPIENSETPHATVAETILALDHPVKSLADAALELHRCLEIAHKFSGSASVSGGGSRYRNLPAGGFALDMRQLFEALRHEETAVVMFYSWNESKPLFVNTMIKSLLGWNPESFIQNFHEIISDGVQEWKHSLAALRTKGETQARISMKNKAGYEVKIDCILGRIQSGLFKNHVIAIFYNPL